jgi:stage V sporulation protein D (sporulation-specific penicillin-binding protein)
VPMTLSRERDGGINGRRLRALRFGVFIAFGVLWGKLFLLQIVSAQYYQDIANEKYSLYEQLVPERGKILVHDFDDETEYEVATNEPRAFVFADPRKVTNATDAGKRIAQALGWEGVDEYDRAALIASLEAQGKLEEAESLRALDGCAVADEEPADPAGDEVVTEIAAEDTSTVVPAVSEKSEECIARDAAVEKITDLIARLGKTGDPYEPVAQNVDAESLDRLLALDLDGIDYVLKDARSYPEAGFSGQVLGFIGRNSDDKPVGQYGVEGYFEDFLAGTPGVLASQADASGSWIGVGSRAYTPAIDGGSLVLTIDRTVEYTACAMLKAGVEKFDADGGSLVIVEPSTGRILAMCGTPDFDPNDFGNVEEISTYNNQSIFTPYEPGSIFKSFTLAAGLDTGAITPNSTFSDPGFVKVDDRTIHNANDKTYGTIAMTTALEESVNTAMVWVEQRTGKDVFAQYVRDFGFGTLSGVQLNSEVAGDIDSLDRYGEVFAATASFGQGITTTPLQLAMAYAAIANGGTLMAPQIVDEMRYADGTVDTMLPKLVRQVVDSKTAVTLSGMLVSAVENGHGKRAGVSGYWVAGKTGTAQIAINGVYSETAFNGSFAGFAPVDDPKFAMVVKIENPKSDHILYAESTAAPLFGEIAKYLLQYYRIAPTR